MPKPTRQELWHHNSLLGWAAQAKSMCVAIQQAKTTTEKSQALSMEIGLLISQLQSSLRTRKDHEE